MKVLVIGGTGYVGSNIVRLINADEVKYFSRNENKSLSDKGFKWIQGDITVAEKVSEAVKDADMVVDAAGVETPSQEAFAVNVTGVKNIAAALNKNDTNQRLVYMSAINVHYGTTDFFRTKRTGEDNAALVKNHLNVRPSVIFGNGDRFTEKVLKIASLQSLGKLPSGGSLSPVHIEDVVRVIEAAKDLRGSVDISSRDKISLADIINLALEMQGKKVRKVVEGFGLSKAVERLKSLSIFTPDEVDKYLLDYYRENTYLDRFVRESRSYREYLKTAVKA